MFLKLFLPLLVSVARRLVRWSLLEKEMTITTYWESREGTNQLRLSTDTHVIVRDVHCIGI